MFLNNEHKERQYNYSLFCCLYISIVVIIIGNCIAFDYHSYSNKYISARIYQTSKNLTK